MRVVAAGTVCDLGYVDEACLADAGATPIRRSREMLAGLLTDVSARV